MDTQLWRGLAAYRALALIYTAVQFGFLARDYAHPLRGWLVIALMAAWTVLVSAWYARTARAGSVVLALDLLLSALVLVLSGLADEPRVVAERSLPMLWAAAAVVAWALARGWLAGLLATAAVAVAAAAVRQGLSATVVNNAVLLALAAAVLGWVAAVARDAAQARAEAVAVRAEQRERDRLGRVVHDGVLQLLAQVVRRGPELGSAGAALAQEAGVQEASLRALLSAGAAPPPGRADLADELSRLGSTRVAVAVPGDPVLLPRHLAEELVAAVRAALDNTERHAPGARSWVLLEDTGTALAVTVRDDGPGMAPGRLPAAAAEGRLGASHSIIGRLEHLGGAADVRSTPGQGVEVELRLPHEAGHD